MKIDKRLNLVIPVYQDDKPYAYVHSTPISSDVFDTYFMPISKTFAQIYAQGFGMFAGPRIADKMLKRVAVDMGIWEGRGNVQEGLLAEIYRLTNVVVSGKTGWETVPYHEAKTKGLIDADDVAEVEAAIIFFTVASAMHRKTELAVVLGGMANIWGAQIESSNSTDFMNSLPKLIGIDSSGAKAVA